MLRFVRHFSPPPVWMVGQYPMSRKSWVLLLVGCFTRHWFFWGQTEQETNLYSVPVPAGKQPTLCDEIGVGGIFIPHVHRYPMECDAHGTPPAYYHSDSKERSFQWWWDFGFCMLTTEPSWLPLLLTVTRDFSLSLVIYYSMLAVHSTGHWLYHSISAVHPTDHRSSTTELEMYTQALT